MDSPDHRANILDPTFQQTGVAALPGVPGSALGPGSATYTQEFGEILGSS
jgi:uncharacterized protein YkwD